MPGPAQRARTRIERAYFTGGPLRPHVVCNTRTDDNEIRNNSRRRGLFVFTFEKRLTAESLCQIDLAVTAKIGARLSGFRVQRSKPRIDTRKINSATATFAVSLVRIEPCRNTAIR